MKKYMLIILLIITMGGCKLIPFDNYGHIDTNNSLTNNSLTKTDNSLTNNSLTKTDNSLSHLSKLYLTNENYIVCKSNTLNFLKLNNITNLNQIIKSSIFYDKEFKIKFFKYLNIPILINSATIESDYLNKVDWRIKFINVSIKIIKYIYISVTPYNRVGDMAYCEISNKSQLIGSATGPIKYDDEQNSTWNGWFNSTINRLIINKIKIIYMDNSEHVLNEKFIYRYCYISGGGK